MGKITRKGVANTFTDGVWIENFGGFGPYGLYLESPIKDLTFRWTVHLESLFYLDDDMNTPLAFHELPKGIKVMSTGGIHENSKMPTGWLHWSKDQYTPPSENCKWTDWSAFGVSYGFPYVPSNGGFFNYNVAEADGFVKQGFYAYQLIAQFTYGYQSTNFDGYYIIEVPPPLDPPFNIHVNEAASVYYQAYIEWEIPPEARGSFIKDNPSISSSHNPEHPGSTWIGSGEHVLIAYSGFGLSPGDIIEIELASGNIYPTNISEFVKFQWVVPPVPPGLEIAGNLNIDIALQSKIQLIGDPSGIYTLVKDKRYDTLYERNAGVVTTQDVKIPDPFIRTLLLGK